MSSNEEGEIPFLDADRLEDHGERAVEVGEDFTKSYGSEDDTRAVLSLIANLRKTPSGEGLSAEQLEDKAIALYAKFCQIVLSGSAASEQLEKIAELTGEDTDSMRRRLEAEDDNSGDEGGASGLLRALSQP